VPARVLPERPAPGAFWGDYPQRDPDRARRLTHALLGRLRALDGRRSPGHARVVLARADALAASAAPLAALAGAVRRRLAAGAASRALRIDALALACLAARRVLHLDPYPSQVQAAAVMLDDGLAELATGEGKTLALALAAGARALAGVPVHVVTVNDYLVARDCEALTPYYRALGLACDRVLAADPPERRRLAWQRDVTYCTSHELMFDYLRDRLARADRSDLGGLAATLGGARDAPAVPLMRGLCSAFLDEADSVLVDEATLPCILAQPGADPAEGCGHALAVAGTLWQGRDYRLEPVTRRARLTDAGRDRVAQACVGRDGPWRLERHRDGLVAQALAALHLYHRDRDYLVREDRIEIVDPNTGRVAVGRSWSAGLHQMIEHKERAAGTLPHRTVIQVTPAQCFVRYWRLGGLSATLAEAGGELAAGYGVTVTRIAPRERSRRVDLGLHLHSDRRAQHAAVIARADRLAAAGRPVLVAVRDVAESAALAAGMAAAGLVPALIDARHVEREAEAVAAAGRAGRITIATDMAGRGTDILLDEAARAAGGLALVATHRHASRRLDRQLHGRVARRGEPGTVETHLALEAPVSGTAREPRLPPFVGRLPSGIASRVAGALLWVIQRDEATRASHRRRRLREAARQRTRLHVVGRVDD
jgi:preprotein translocase subunit SecA